MASGRFGRTAPGDPADILYAVLDPRVRDE
jgi:hypothetical protein